jgi:putative ATPase
LLDLHLSSTSLMAMSDQTGLFSGAMPLAARMRPSSLAELVGQSHLLKPGSPLQALASKAVPGEKSSTVSVILWGPPGTGKTTIAQLVARLSGRRFVELSAITAGVKDVREVMERARADRDAYGVNTVLFLDEIHRFSKAQQDALLPGVENGWIVLIAATTENPSFSVISPLLSRSLLLTLTALDDTDIVILLNRALSAPQGLGNQVTASSDVLAQIALISGGDARRALTILEAAATVCLGSKPDTDLAQKLTKQPVLLTEEHVSGALDRALVRYDKDGDQHYDVISAFIKSVRGSDADAAIHYLARMIEAGEDSRFIARRLIILAAEDIGLADPAALPLAVAAAEAVALIGMPEGRIPLAEATIYLALAPKSNSAYNAINLAIEDIRGGLFGEVPKPLRSSNHSGAKGAGAGVGYLYPHDDPKSVVSQRYLDDKTMNRIYFSPKSIGVERELVERWAKLRSIIRNFKK